MVVLIALLILFGSIILGIPIGFAFLASAIYMIIAGGYDPSFLLPYGYSQMTSIILLTIPLFVIAGGLMAKGKIGERLIEFVEVIAGRIKGGLGVVAVVASGIFGSISGSSSATVSSIGSIMFPKLREKGYPVGHSAALIASAGVLGILIPPSGLMIVYGWMGNVSVLASWLATAIPGLIVMFLLCLVNLFLLRKNQNIKVSQNYNFQTTTRIFGRKTVKATPALLMPVIILGGIYGGVMTPTEGAAVSVIYALFVGFFIYKGLNRSNLIETILDTVKTTGMIMLMLFGVVILSRMLIMENIHNAIVELLTAVSNDKFVILMMVNVFMILIGMLMDDTSAVLLATPILLPVVTQFGVDPVHFAAIVGVNLGMGNITPPTAPLLYLAGSIGEAKINEILTPTMYMILFAWLPTLIIVTYFPEISLFLPRLILGY